MEFLTVCFSYVPSTLTDLLCAPQEMAVRALKQTGSRNIEAALEYISKMGYLDPRNELIVRVIKQTSPGNLNNSCLARMCYCDNSICGG